MEFIASLQLLAGSNSFTCTLEKVKSLVGIASDFRSVLNQLKSDNTALKLQLRDLHEAPAHMPFIP
jgi:hypothetical protein